MACGNNHVSRAALQSQPTPVSQQLPSLENFQALPQHPSKKVQFFVDEDGRADTSKRPGERVIDQSRHVHVVYNATTNGKDGPPQPQPTGLITVTVTDRSNADDIRDPRTGNSKKGHVEETIFLRPQSPERIEAEVSRAVEVLRSRNRGPY
ncbi:hypothetical protein GCM10012320_35520 [Sinomonas cellulolyticus]|nr:hypothetical protein GCM10012320_35520 [Sinomonas sp. KCTC 49339]